MNPTRSATSAPAASDPDEADGAAAPAADAPTLPRAFLLAILAVGAVPYLFGLDGGFVHTDTARIVGEPLLHDLARLPELLVSPGPGTAAASASASDWRPVTALVLAFAWALGGGSALAFHFVSLAAHLIAVALVARIGRALTRSAHVGLAGALLFAVHPVGVEAVAFASALATPLALAFGLGALERWIAWRRAGSNGRPWLAVAMLALAVLAKESALIVPVLIALFDATALRSERRPGRGSDARAWSAVGVGVGLVWLAHVVVVGGWSGGLLSSDGAIDAGFTRLAALRVEVVGGALALALAPFELRLFRSIHGHVDLGDLALPFAACVLFAVLLVVERARARRSTVGDRGGLALVAWPLVVLAPLALRADALGLFPLTDRVVHAAVPGVALFVALLAFRAGGRARGAAATVLPWLAIGVLAVLFGVQGARRTSAFESNAAFWERAAAEDPNIAYVQWNRGRLALEEFKRTPTLAVAERAFERFKDALDIAEGQKPGVDVPGSQNDRLQAYLGTGWSLLQQAEVDGYGDYGTPLAYFELVLGLAALTEGGTPRAIVPGGQNSPEAWAGRGIALARLGRVPEALESLGRALELRPDDALAHFNKGLVHWRAGEPVPASNHLGRALELRPNDAEYAEFAAWAEADRGRVERARELADRARDLDASRSGPHVLLGILARRAGDVTRALELHLRAVELDASNAQAHKELGETYLAVGEQNEALAAFVEACRLGPNLFEPHWNAASLLLASGVPTADVVPYLRRAYELCPDPQRIGQLGANLDALLEPGDPLRRSLALFDEQRGALDAALYWAESAAAANDPNGASAYVFGRLLLASDNVEGAVEWLRIANERRPGQFPRLRELGSALAAAGDVEGARAAWEEALEVLPPAPEGQEWQEENLRAQILSGLAGLDEEADGTTSNGDQPTDG